jgi:hypothetical protein
LKIDCNRNKPEALPSKELTRKRVKVVGVLTVSLVLFVILTLSLLSHFSIAVNATATVDNSIKMTKQESFRDSNGRLNIIGVVDNNGKIPVSITIGLNVVDKKNDAESVTTITDPTYGKISDNEFGTSIQEILIRPCVSCHFVYTKDHS